VWERTTGATDAAGAAGKTTSRGVVFVSRAMPVAFCHRADGLCQTVALPRGTGCPLAALRHGSTSRPGGCGGGSERRSLTGGLTQPCGSAVAGRSTVVLMRAVPMAQRDCPCARPCRRCQPGRCLTRRCRSASPGSAVPAWPGPVREPAPVRSSLAAFTGWALRLRAIETLRQTPGQKRRDDRGDTAVERWRLGSRVAVLPAQSPTSPC
jgi:hypothetical protein